MRIFSNIVILTGLIFQAICLANTLIGQEMDIDQMYKTNENHLIFTLNPIIVIAYKHPIVADREVCGTGYWRNRKNQPIPPIPNQKKVCQITRAKSLEDLIMSRIDSLLNKEIKI